MPRDRRVLLIDTEVADPIRASMGPVAWFVLEALAGNAPPGQARLEVAAGTRQLAATVSLSKDTVARAMRRLGDAGVVVRVDHRDSLSGRFGSTVYVVDLAAAGLTVEHRDRDTEFTHDSRPRSTTTPREPSASAADDRQLSLLD